MEAQTVHCCLFCRGCFDNMASQASYLFNGPICDGCANRRKGYLRKSKALWRFILSNLLFIHRDAEADLHSTRVREIQQRIHEAVKLGTILPPVVCVVPVRMTEAWFLFAEAESAIRTASGNPRGRVRLEMPRKTTVEGLPDPKQRMRQLLETASERSSRRLRDFRAGERFMRVAELIGDFSPLRGLPAFDALDTEVARVIQEQGWHEISANEMDD
jgi:hypothetical protein